MRLNKIIRLSIYFLIFFSLIYFENLSIGSIKLTLVWKIPFLIYIIIYLLTPGGKKSNVNFSKPAIILGVQKNLNLGFLYSMDSIVQFIKGVNLFLFTKFFISNSSFSAGRIRYYLIMISIFIIVSFIPFQLNLIEPLSTGIDTETFGASSGIIGIFNTAHNAAITLSLSIFCLIYFIKIFDYNTKILITTIISYGIFLMLFTYTRTGLVALLGSCVLYFYSINKGVKIYRFVLLTVLICIPIIFIINSSESLKNKILDKRDNNSEVDFNSVGSGRLYMWSINIYNWYEGTIDEKIFGVGREKALEMMNVKIGRPFFSHNEFVDILLRHGLLGLFLYLLYLYNIYRFIIKKTGGTKYFPLSVLLAYIIINIFQGGHFFIYEVMFALIMAYAYKFNIQRKKMILQCQKKY